MKICILSKNRSQLMTTQHFFDPTDVLIFVDPQEVDEYTLNNPEYTIIGVDKDDMGIACARSFIIDYIKDEYVVILDDDITTFLFRNNAGRYDTLKMPMDIIHEGINYLKTSKGCVAYGIVTLNLQPYAYFENQKLLLNNERYCINRKWLDGIHIINKKFVDKHNIRYRINEGDDLDFSLQLLKAGGDICIDFYYAHEHALRSIGGLEVMRSNKKHVTQIDTEFVIYTSLKQLYDNEKLKCFLTIQHDKFNNFKGFDINMTKAKNIFNK